jgi:Lrp/AsnC family leucine-responsive transcriptional regulator
MSERVVLDDVARRIVAILLEDGRASYQAIADRVGLSRPAVMERVKRLEEAGVITGYAAQVDRARLGAPITAFVAVRYASSDAELEQGAERGVRALARHPYVLEAHHVAGEDCYILKIAAPSLQDLETVLREVREPGRPVSTRTTIVLSTVFEKPGVPPVMD